MSRVGKQPIAIPNGVKIVQSDGVISISGPKGSLSRRVNSRVNLEVKAGEIIVTCPNSEDRAFHGTERSLLANMVTGASAGFSKELELVGVGYRAEQKGDTLELGLGYSHPIFFKVPIGVSASVLKDGRQIFVKLEGADKQQVGQVAATIRSLREPEPYQGKGVRYRDEVIVLKAGKAGKK